MAHPASCSSGQDWQTLIATAVNNQIEEAITRIKKIRWALRRMPYIAYFQSYTQHLRAAFLPGNPVFRSHPPPEGCGALHRHPAGLPADEVLNLCTRLNREKPVWIELGLRTIHEDTAAFIRRGYPLSTFSDALSRLRARKLETIVHVILGLPAKTGADIEGPCAIWQIQDIRGIKLQLLHVLKGTDLASVYEQHPFPVMTLEEYLDLLIDCVACCRQSWSSSTGGGTDQSLC